MVLVIAIVGAAVSNLGMFASLRERVSTLEAKLDISGKSLIEIKSWLEQMNKNTQAEIRDLYKHNSDIRDRVTRLETMMQVQKERGFWNGTGNQQADKR